MGPGAQNDTGVQPVITPHRLTQIITILRPKVLKPPAVEGKIKPLYRKALPLRSMTHKKHSYKTRLLIRDLLKKSLVCRVI